MFEVAADEIEKTGLVEEEDGASVLERCSIAALVAVVVASLLHPNHGVVLVLED